MKVCLIRPPLQVPRFQLMILELPPVGFAYVASAARKAGHEVHVVDALGEAPSQSLPGHRPDLFGRGLRMDQIVARIPADVEALAVASMFSQDWPYLREFVGELRDHFPGVPIIAGGEHVTALPEYCLEDSVLDYCVCGEGEDTLAELLDALDSGRSPAEVTGLVFRGPEGIVRTPPRVRIRAVDELARPAWDLFPVENYLNDCNSFGVDRGRCMPVIGTRGCPYQCTFCSSPAMWTTRWVARDPADVVAEIRELIDKYDVRNIDFYDLTFIIKKAWIVEFCGLIKESGLQFTYQLPTGTRAEAIDDEVAKALYETGCRNITYAPESGAPSELKRIKKRIKVPRMLSSMRACHRNRLLVKANLVFGFPDTSRLQLLQTLGFIALMALVGVRDVIVYLFSAYPGSELYRQLVASGDLPEPCDEYFEKLSATLDASRSVSFCGLSARELTVWRVSGLLLFYGLSFAIRPWRIVQTIYNVARSRQESMLEERLVHLFHNRERGQQSLDAALPENQ